MAEQERWQRPAVDVEQGSRKGLSIILLALVLVAAITAGTVRLLYLQP